MAELQLLPINYSASPEPFRVSGTASGANGARAVLQFDINNDPHLVYGIRLVCSIPPPPDDATAADLALWEAARKAAYENQVKIDMSQLSMAAIEMHQLALCGQIDAPWHPFPVDYPVAGGNKWTVTVTRMFDMPGGYLPVISGTLVCGRMVGAMSEGLSMRRY